MNIFMDLFSTLGVVLPIFVVVLVLSIGIVLLVVWLWDRRRPTTAPQGPVADWYDNYAEPKHAEAKERMDTLSRPVEAPGTAWLDELLNHYHLRLEIDAQAGLVRLHDRKFFELKHKTVEFPVSKVLGADYKRSSEILRAVRSTLNRRAQRQGIIPVKHRNPAVVA